MELNAKFEKLVKKEVKYESSNLGLNLLISRLQRKYAANQTQAELRNCLMELNAFFEKYASIMKNDIEALSKL